ncbi:hypothetical protein [Paenibacillus sp. FSL H8-0537]|uniref:CDI toxin immunity protein n=1 Tax=Paenibacillus sp. FSL H8-0537 TaxID=2921399 RepID=UPI0031016475
MEDRSSRKSRMEQLKKKMKRDISYGELFNECIEVLDVNSHIYSFEKSQELIEKMEKEFRFTNTGRVGWKYITYKFSIKNISDLYSHSLDLNSNYFIILNGNNFPVIETTIGDVIKNFKDIAFVGFNTWIVNFDEGIIIENYHDEEITIGKRDILSRASADRCSE